jgi:hypothetical protein
VEANAAFFELVDDGHEVLQGAAEPVELPHHKRVACFDGGEKSIRLAKSSTSILRHRQALLTRSQQVRNSSP